MSSSDKSKLDNIATNANNYSLPTATATTLGGVKVGSNITNSSGTISLSKANVVSALGYTPSATNTNTTYNVATTTTNGLMSSSDKSKLDNIATNANNYSLPTATATTLGGVKVGNNLSISNGILSAKYSQSLGENGYSKLPNGMILQYGTATTTAVDSTGSWTIITFP